MLPIFALGPHGDGAFVQGVTWNPADKASLVTVSTDGRTLSAVSATGGARGGASRSSGKVYFEIVPTVIAVEVVAGLATSAWDLTLYLGNDAFSIGYGHTGNLQTGGSTVATYAAYTAGDIVGVAIDVGAGKAWFAKNNTWQAGDPAAGTGGVTVPAGAVFPAGFVNPGDALSLPFALTYIPPSGFYPL